MKFLQNEIKSLEDIKNYIDNLKANNMMYHFDDDARDIVNFQDLSEDILDLLDIRTNEALSIDYDYSFNYVCELLEI
ncbi:MAG: hypothetical protein ACOVK2_03935 [Candidatus Fonsibacter sp.]